MEYTKFNDENSVFPLGEPGSPDIFTGEAWVKVLMHATASMQYLVAEVKYEAGGRTHWHTHPLEQVLLCTDGAGIYQERGKDPVPLSKGDVYVIPPYVEHWHGAKEDQRFAHVAITNYKDGKNVDWTSPVNKKEYEEANRSGQSRISKKEK